MLRKGLPVFIISYGRWSSPADFLGGRFLSTRSSSFWEKGVFMIESGSFGSCCLSLCANVLLCWNSAVWDVSVGVKWWPLIFMRLICHCFALCIGQRRSVPLLSLVRVGSAVMFPWSVLFLFLNLMNFQMFVGIFSCSLESWGSSMSDRCWNSLIMAVFFNFAMYAESCFCACLLSCIAWFFCSVLSHFWFVCSFVRLSMFSLFSFANVTIFFRVKSSGCVAEKAVFLLCSCVVLFVG